MAKDNTSFNSQKKGSNILCRVANPSARKVCEYINLLPKQPMSEANFRATMGTSWFQNIHQAPEQWGLYYLDNGRYYPRFNRTLSEEEAKKYIYGWMKRLPIINPYTKFKICNDNNLVLSIVKHLEEDNTQHDLKTIIKDILKSDEAFIVNDILANSLNNLSEVLLVKAIDGNNELFNVYLQQNYKEIIREKYMTKETYFHLFDGILNTIKDLPLQQIFYGSPGTGKSRAVNDIIGEQTAEAIRTTFHPDSDYASFVGAYKPVMEVVGEKKQIAYKFVKQAFLKAYIKAWQKFAEAESLDNIALQYLVIEEINRGNCAQIFGDLFQLLDRNDSGYSEYPIEADEDLAASLAEVESENNPSFGPGGLKLKGFKMEKLIDQYKKTNGEEEANAIAKDICVGKRLAFPPNLHILATMNTSDQSLFPMDSAFKRRWEWKYVPIKYDEPKSKEFTITIGKESNQYKFNWIEFLKAVNDKIIRVSQSEDKLLGNFFIKGNIGEEEFKGKVMFYIWSEVCKEEFRTDNNFMRHLDKDKTEKISNAESRESAKEILQSNMSETGPEEFSFSDLYGNDGTDILLGFMYNLGVLPLDHKASQPTEEPGQTPAASTGAEGPAEGDSESQE